MSELFELLTQAAQHSDRKNAEFKFAKLIVFVGGETQVLIGDKVVAYGINENEMLETLREFVAGEKQ